MLHRDASVERQIKMHILSSLSLDAPVADASCQMMTNERL